ncbi:MAG: hypothetical protein V4719_10680 [Planctomycetota bacterium]
MRRRTSRAGAGLYNRGQRVLYQALHPLARREFIASAVRFLESCGAPHGLPHRLKKRFLKAQRAFPV